MPDLSAAPGGPGLQPTWSSSAKDMVTTALGTSRVWVTLGYGILNEVYWPATGTPQIRDLGFIVAGPSVTMTDAPASGQSVDASAGPVGLGDDQLNPEAGVRQPFQRGHSKQRRAAKDEVHHDGITIPRFSSACGSCVSSNRV